MQVDGSLDIAPLQRQKLGDDAADQLRRLIIRGRLRPGTPLVEREICQLLAISRTPTRDALKTLEHEGFLAQQGKSLVVGELSLKQAREYYELICNLEQFLVCSATPLTPGQATALRRRNTTVTRKGGDPAALVELDRDFHLALVTNHRNDVALHQYRQTRMLAARYDFAFYSASHTPVPSGDQHAQLIDHLSQGDRDEACAVLRRHWLDTLPQLLAVIEDLEGWSQ